MQWMLYIEPKEISISMKIFIFSSTFNRNYGARLRLIIDLNVTTLILIFPFVRLHSSMCEIQKYYRIYFLGWSVIITLFLNAEPFNLPEVFCSDAVSHDILIMVVLRVMRFPRIL